MIRTSWADPENRGNVLRQARERHGLSLGEMARRINYSKGYLSRLETWGTSPNGYRPSEDVISAYADALGVERKSLETVMTDWADPGPTGTVAMPLPSSGAARRPAPPTGTAPNVDHLESITSQVRRGRQDVMETATALVAGVQEATSPGLDCIVMTFQGPEPFEGSQEQSAPFWSAARTAMERGWTVLHLFRLDGDTRRAMRLVDRSLSMGWNSRYVPRYFPSHGVLTPSHDLLVVPGRGALLLFATEKDDSDDAAWYSTEPEHVAVLASHARRLQQKTVPLLNMIGTQNLLSWQAHCSEFDHRGGERLIVNDGMPMISEPASWYQDNANTPHGIGVPPERGGEITEYRQDRQSAFERLVRLYRHREIIPKSAVTNWQANGSARAGDATVFTQSDLRGRIERIENLKHILRSTPNFEIGLSEMDTDQLRAPWVVHGDYGVSCPTRGEADTPMGNGVQHYVEITEPTVVEGFRERFEQLWAGVPPRDRDKQNVLEWLQSHSEACKGQLD